MFTYLTHNLLYHAHTRAEGGVGKEGKLVCLSTLSKTVLYT